MGRKTPTLTLTRPFTLPTKLLKSLTVNVIQCVTKLVAKISNMFNISVILQLSMLTVCVSLCLSLKFRVPIKSANGKPLNAVCHVVIQKSLCSCLSTGN